MNVAPEAEDDFNAWYDQEHLAALAGVPGTLAARRYRSTEANRGTHRYVALYHLESPDVTRSTAWKAAVDTPWSARVLPHMRDRIRLLTHRYVRAG
jgi:heme-degrading monooxygenase HmoA